jgi:adenine-specific DNA-methyltransferase
MATLSFKGKSFIQNHHLGVKYHELIPVKKNSLTSKVSLKDNLIIHGDNLKALKALLPTYAGKIKCIYIDPPYNIGNEGWVYNDSVNSPMMQEWLGKVVDIEDLTRHDKWLCMMMPRLKLLKELLRPDGVIFVSIDDNEVHNLRILMEDIFQDNFLGAISIVNNLKGRSDDEFIATANDYLIVYAKNKNKYEMGGFPLSAEQLSEYDQEDQWGRYKEVGFRKTGKGWRREDRPRMFYPIYFNESTSDIALERESKDDIEIEPLTSDKQKGRWRWEKQEFLRRKDRDIVIRKVRTGRWAIFTKMRLEENGEERTLLPKSVWIDPKYDTAKGAALVRDIFGKDVFDNPKPLDFVKDIIRISTDKDKGDIVLDSFAGSGTTAHAVMDLNKEDGGNRKFILVECLDYADNITAERIRRIDKGVPSARDEKLQKGLGGSFSFFELGEPIEMESILEGSRLPSYLDLARYVFYTATSEEFLPEQVDEDKHFIGESKDYEVYLFYKPDLDYLKSTALTLEVAKALGDYTGKKKLVFAPTKYLDLNDSELLAKHGLKDIEYCQLPFEIYKLKE